MVDFPEAERPVNQIVRPGWERRVLRSRWVKACGCQVMLLYLSQCSCFRCYIAGSRDGLEIPWVAYLRGHGICR